MKFLVRSLTMTELYNPRNLYTILINIEYSFNKNRLKFHLHEIFITIRVLFWKKIAL